MRVLKDLAGAILLVVVGTVIIGICMVWDTVADLFRRRV